MEKSLAEHIAEARRGISYLGQNVLDLATKEINDEVDLSLFSEASPLALRIVAAMLIGVKDETIFQTQLEGLLTRSDCTCGCPGLAFAVRRDHGRASVQHNLLAERTGMAPDGLVGLILWQAGGKLTGLEVYDLGNREDNTPYQLPDPATLQPI